MSLNFFCFHTTTGQETETSSDEGRTGGDNVVCFRIRCGSLTSDARYAQPTRRRPGIFGRCCMCIRALDPATGKWVRIAEGTDRETSVCIRRAELVGSELEFTRAITPHVDSTTPELWRAKMMDELTAAARRCSLDPTISLCVVFMKTLTLEKRGDRDEELERLASATRRALPPGAVFEPATPSSIGALRTAGEEELLGTDDCCPVCMNEYGSEDVLIMPCSHRFHRNCIAQWLLVNHVCPYCRFSMPHETFYRDPEMCSTIPFFKIGSRVVTED